MSVKYEHQIFWGDLSTAIDPEQFDGLTAETVLMQEPFKTLQQEFDLTACIMLNQIHGVNGFIVNAATDLSNVLVHKEDADFSITDQKKVALVSFTADCLSLVFIDVKKGIAAIAHAGWKGTVNKIAQKTVAAMHEQFGANIQDIKVFFGPSALVCCYEVQQDFVLALQHDFFAQKALCQRNNKIYFDVPYYNQLVLQAVGIRSTSCDFQAQCCTMCKPGYASYRGQNGTKLRNITFVSLK